jgi:drug/metabolite transporter (DMT)-like permease
VKQGTKALGVLLVGAGILGFSGIFVRWSAPASPVMVGFYRMVFALPWVLLLTWRDPEPVKSSAAQGIPWAVLAGLAFTGDLTLWHLSMHWTSVAAATLLVGLAPLWVALFMAIFLGARLRGRAWTGLALALIGTALLALAKGAKLSGNFGEAMALLSSFCYAAYTLALARARRHLSAISALFWIVLSSLAFFAILAILRGDTFHGFPTKSWCSLIGLGFLVQALGWWLISWGMGRVPTHVGAVGLVMQSVTTVILGWILLHEHLLPIQGLGTLLILFGIALCSLAPALPKRT